LPARHFAGAALCVRATCVAVRIAGLLAARRASGLQTNVTNAYSDLGFWFDSLGEIPVPTVPELPTEVDIAIVGAGYTGLWTAYYLTELQPNAAISIFEAETVGFGASGRNGGWCMGEAHGLDHYEADPRLRAAGRRLHRAMIDTVDEIGRVSQAENIDCHYARGGWLTVAHLPFHAGRLEARVRARHAQGFTEQDYRWLPPAEAGARFRPAARYGAALASHCAAIHPARLVRGLGDLVRRRGVRILERTPVVRIEPRRVHTLRGEVRARLVLRATEAYTGSLAGHGRDLLPFYSMITATEPLPESLWQEIGLARREVFDDPRRLVIYGQRSLDDRLVFGGRGSYLFGSRRQRSIPRTDPNVQRVERLVRELFPMLDGHAITHGWGGMLGIPRHWRPCVTFDAGSGMGSAGGYVGEGVAASNLAGRILADLALGRASELTTLPWVGDTPRRWEPEPLRWLGVKAMRWVGSRADAAEAKHARPSRFWGPVFDHIAG
jgi:glycine/D-amino acid oxidase-like deaminating enzyme